MLLSESHLDKIKKDSNNIVVVFNWQLIENIIYNFI